MSDTTARPGEVIDLHGESRLETLLTGKGLQLSRVVLPAGEKYRSHDPHAEVVVVCLEGRARAYVNRAQPELIAGQLLRLPGGEPCALDALAPTLLLLISAPRQRRTPDDVEIASEQSFPASDAPAWTPLASTGSPH